MSRLVRIEKSAFTGSGLKCIVIPSSVEFFGDECFSECKHLQSMTFDANSRLRHIGRKIFFGSAISPMLPSTRCMVFWRDCHNIGEWYLQMIICEHFHCFHQDFKGPSSGTVIKNRWWEVIIFWSTV
jgi:hypothetical protein